NCEVVHSVRCQVELSISQQLDTTSAAESVAQELNLAASPIIRPVSGGDEGISGGRVHISRAPAEGQDAFGAVSGDRSSIDCDVTIARSRPGAKCDLAANGVGHGPP